MVEVYPAMKLQLTNSNDGTKAEQRKVVTSSPRDNQRQTE